ncbi:DUF192 domain-containing protein|uniref:DUF192 domain-containing protein n=1 Tax=Dendrosporobacter quercicolus TaxID=146817 RepID=A0A1H0A3I8_9FIRM|nr:DUF192 domain-containing protein [Dendrosporobacter quercicolus]NSL49997.1 DUF192 domain-containing protein [Dendrosporobacter quercicolus DSM 1736]SDN27975.1 hypothetical protein SAMN04488502_11642 [Dendrosporobacter quercicolus]
MKKITLFLEGKAIDKQLEIFVADTFFTRFKGLLGTRLLPEHEGLLLRGCNSVHMLGMRYALDIVYLDSTGTIVKLVENLRPWQISFCRQAQDTLEVNCGTVRSAGWKIGDRLELHN